jgi:hypothetical protein
VSGFREGMSIWGRLYLTTLHQGGPGGGRQRQRLGQKKERDTQIPCVSSNADSLWDTRGAHCAMTSVHIVSIAAMVLLCPNANYIRYSPFPVSQQSQIVPRAALLKLSYQHAGLNATVLIAL